MSASLSRIEDIVIVTVATFPFYYFHFVIILRGTISSDEWSLCLD